MQKKKIAVIVGSLRKEAFSRKLAKALMALAPPSLEMEILEIGQLPLYNQDNDDESKPHPEWVEFRKRLKPFDGALFVTPEHNRSVPSALKNAIDVGSRPYGQSVWSGKPCAVASISPGAIGGFGANHHLRQSFVFLDMPCMQAPEAYFSNAAKLFGPNGEITNDSTKNFAKAFMTSFANWIDQAPDVTKASAA